MNIWEDSNNQEESENDMIDLGNDIYIKRSEVKFYQIMHDNLHKHFAKIYIMGIDPYEK